MGPERRIVVIVGGGPLRHVPDIDGSTTVIAVDSGLDVALAAGITPSLLVGDLDSISSDGVRWARCHRVPIERHPADKDATDTALALTAALRIAADEGAARLDVRCGVATDRLDHVLGVITALGAPDLASFESIRATIGATVVHVVHPHHAVVLDLPAGGVFSLLALHGGCRGVDVHDARWPLADATIAVSATIGISNESLGTPVTVRCAEGVLSVLVPEVTS